MLPALAILQAPLCLALAIEQPASSVVPRGDYSETNFEYLRVQQKTGLNPYYFLEKPALSLPRVSVCLPREFGEPHVDGCNIAFDNIPNLKDKNGNFAVKPGQCRAINAQCCQVTICAPRLLNLLVPSTEVHLQVTKSAANCTAQHLGSIYMDNGWDYLIMVHKPKDPQCWPDDGKMAKHTRVVIDYCWV
ncbi:SSCRP protein [Trichoderma parareesei]|uniref:SSCRP protein n=1 Tax=Trichoderma parareesei TaxID=858221 RepID=A0A2H2ZCH3_TRIPA|nr:SSCRP protein [Trichoderma parareesei]